VSDNLLGIQHRPERVGDANVESFRSVSKSVSVKLLSIYDLNDKLNMVFNLTFVEHAIFAILLSSFDIYKTRIY